MSGGDLRTLRFRRASGCAARHAAGTASEHLPPFPDSSLNILSDRQLGLGLARRCISSQTQSGTRLLSARRVSPCASADANPRLCTCTLTLAQIRQIFNYMLVCLRFDPRNLLYSSTNWCPGGESVNPLVPLRPRCSDPGSGRRGPGLRWLRRRPDRPEGQTAVQYGSVS